MSIPITPREPLAVDRLSTKLGRSSRPGRLAWAIRSSCCRASTVAAFRRGRGGVSGTVWMCFSVAITAPDELKVLLRDDSHHLVDGSRRRILARGGPLGLSERLIGSVVRLFDG